MYLHLGQSVVVPHKNILGIFDLDNSSWAYKTREFLERAEQEAGWCRCATTSPDPLCWWGMRRARPRYTSLSSLPPPCCGERRAASLTN